MFDMAEYNSTVKEQGYDSLATFLRYAESVLCKHRLRELADQTGLGVEAGRLEGISTSTRPRACEQALLPVTGHAPTDIQLRQQTTSGLTPILEENPAPVDVGSPARAPAV